MSYPAIPATGFQDLAALKRTWSRWDKQRRAAQAAVETVRITRKESP